MRMLKAAQGAMIATAVVLLLIAFTVSCASEDAQRDNNQAKTIGATRAPIFREADRGHGADPGTRRKNAQGDTKNAALNSVQARLMKELRLIRKSESHKQGIIDVELADDNIQDWRVKLHVSDGPLHDGLLKLKEKGGKDHIMLQVSFGENYPHEPPFVRIVYPVLEGPVVYEHGSLCMNILMENGWDSSCAVEAFVLTILSGLLERNVKLYSDQSIIDKYHYEEGARISFEGIKEFHKDFDFDD